MLKQRKADQCDKCGGEFGHKRKIVWRAGVRMELCQKCGRDDPYNVISDAPSFTLWGGSH